MPIAALLQVLALGLQYTPELISACETEYELLRSGSDPTAEQLAQMEAAQAQAHAAVQAAQ